MTDKPENTITAAPFYTDIIASVDFTKVVLLGFIGLQQLAALKGSRYLKNKTLEDVKQAGWIATVQNRGGQGVGQCLLSDVRTSKAAYTAVYPGGKTLILTSLFMNAGHDALKYTVPKGQGPLSTLFREIEIFAAMQDYERIVAKTSTANDEGRMAFEERGFIPSSPFRAPGEDYDSLFYAMDVQAGLAPPASSPLS